MTDVVDLGPLIAGGGDADPALTATVAGSHPIVLLPVRLETRYVEATGGERELLVRVWPDQVHIDSHDPRLSEAEAEAGRQFWLADWRSGDDQERRQRAWRALAERFDPGRARLGRPRDAARERRRPTGRGRRRHRSTASAADVRADRADRAAVHARRPSAARRLDGDRVRERKRGGRGHRPTDHRRPGGGARSRRTAGSSHRRRRPRRRGGPGGGSRRRRYAVARRLRRRRGHRHGAPVARGGADRPAAGDRCPRRWAGRRRRRARRAARRPALHLRAGLRRSGHADEQHRRCSSRVVERRHRFVRCAGCHRERERRCAHGTRLGPGR